MMPGGYIHIYNLLVLLLSLFSCAFLSRAYKLCNLGISSPFSLAILIGFPSMTSSSIFFPPSSLRRTLSCLSTRHKDVGRMLSELRTVPHRTDRVIAGLSAGAYGAANVGLHHLGLFGGIQVWSGYFLETHDGVFSDADPATMFANSPLDYVWRLRVAFRRDPTHVFIYIGNGDSNRAQTPPMTADLLAVGARAQDAIYPGYHSWTLWTAHADRMLELASHWFAHPA